MPIEVDRAVVKYEFAVDDEPPFAQRTQGTTKRILPTMATVIRSGSDAPGAMAIIVIGRQVSAEGNISVKNTFQIVYERLPNPNLPERDITTAPQWVQEALEAVYRWEQARETR